jgi:D-alanyl-D-alanine carboxypeptidase (penicillin-binding protein 5/6)
MMHLQRLSTIRNLILSGVALTMFVSSAQAIETPAKQAVLIDYQTGQVLFEKNADERMTPSSMSKMATVYLAFQRLKEGRLSLEDTFPVSEKAWRKQGSKMFVALNSRVKAEDLLRGIIVASGNDACIVLAEGLSGTEDAFGRELTDLAQKLGMKGTNLVNSSGWPDPNHYSTARDLATLATATIRNFPEYYPYYAEKNFVYNGIKQGNRDPLLYKDTGADGLKTGHTEEAGYGLTASAIRNGRRLIMVVNGLNSMKERASESEKLMDYGFREFNNYQLFTANSTVGEAPVWLGTEARVPLILKNDVTVTMPIKSRKGMVVKTIYESPIQAPIEQGARIATLRIEVPDRPVMELPLVAGKSVEKLGMVSRLGAALRHIVWGENG